VGTNVISFPYFVLSEKCLKVLWIFITALVSVADPGSGAFLTPGSEMKKSAYWIWDPGPAINIPDHIFKSLVTIICIKNAQFPCYRSGSWIRCLFNPGMEKLGFGIWDEQWYRNWHFFSPLYFEFEIEIVLGIPSFNRWKNLTCLISSESGTLPLVFQIQNLLMCIRSVSYSRLHIIKLVRSGHFLCVLTFYRNLANFKRGRFLTVPGTYRLRKVESGS
jgi:hypothetical protein